MYLFEPAARRCGRIPRFLLLSALLLLASLHSEAAFSASLAVKIRQLNPDGQIQQVTCAENKKCILPISIQTAQAQKETLNVDIEFSPGNVLFEFQTPDGYLYAGDKNAADKQHALYEIIWHGIRVQPKPSVSDVTLFLPTVLNAFVAPILHVVKQPVADLEITTEAGP